MSGLAQTARHPTWKYSAGGLAKITCLATGNRTGNREPGTATWRQTSRFGERANSESHIMIRSHIGFLAAALLLCSIDAAAQPAPLPEQVVRQWFDRFNA